ncbi:MAG TPA: hypothetical protein PKW95_11945 [bacterium]|nr:hypothetical protein [bacterium]
MKYSRFVLIIGVLLMTILFSCSNHKNDDDDDDDDSADDDYDDDIIPILNENWSYNLIDEYSSDCSLSLDLDNNVFIVYYAPLREDGYDELFYVNSIDNWQIYPFPKHVGSWHTTPAMDSVTDEQDNLHFLYPVQREGGKFICELYYSKYDGDSWSYDKISDAVYTDPYSLSIDNVGNAHISYYDESEKNGDLIHVDNSTGSWQYEVVEENAGKYMGYCRAVIKTLSDSLYLLYVITGENYGDNHLVYAQKNDDVWEKIIVAENVDSATMDIDSLGNAHILYRNDDILVYVSNMSGEFISKRAADGYCNWAQELVVDENNNVHIIHSGSMYNTKSGSYYVNNISGNWISEEISAYLTDVISAEIDSEQVLHVAMNAGDYLCHLTREIPQE